MRQKAIDNLDKEYEKELDAKNKAKAGINEDTIRLDWVKQKDKAGQIKYFGSKSRWALVESGVVTKDEQLFKVKTTPKGKVTVKKTLKELRKEGIITVSESRVYHSTKGDFKFNSPKELYPNGRMLSGGHSVVSRKECDKLGIEYEINGEYSNGVKFGNVPSSSKRFKRERNGQLWFPDDWTEEDIMLAGTAVANSKNALYTFDEIPGKEYVIDVYNGVAVRVFFKDKQISTICPDLDQIKWLKGVKIKWKK